MRATFHLPETLGASVIDAALEGLVRASEADIRAHDIPPLATAGVRYARERGESWLTPSQVIERGHGDCEDLAAWRAAELRVSGVDPHARAVVYRSGPRTWHAVVERSDGSIEDPSVALGMRDDRPAEWPRITVGRADCAACGTPWTAEWAWDRTRIVGVGDTPDAAIRGDTSIVGADDVGFLPGLDIVSRLIPGLAPQPQPKPQTQPQPQTRREPEPESDDPDVLRFARKLARWLRRERARALRDLR